MIVLLRIKAKIFFKVLSPKHDFYSRKLIQASLFLSTLINTLNTYINPKKLSTSFFMSSPFETSTLMLLAKFLLRNSNCALKNFDDRIITLGT